MNEPPSRQPAQEQENTESGMNRDMVPTAQEEPPPPPAEEGAGEHNDGEAAEPAPQEEAAPDQ
jgi:hypothetical protein